jgi:hypothetical protein
MPEYSIKEYADMHFVYGYGECSGNANTAVRRYVYVMETEDILNIYYEFFQYK